MFVDIHVAAVQHTWHSPCGHSNAYTEQHGADLNAKDSDIKNLTSACYHLGSLISESFIKLLMIYGCIEAAVH